jgi:hypothetical protein
MTSQQVSQFISTYGLPPPPNKYSPRRARLPVPGMNEDLYHGVASIMSTPRGMKIGRRQESLGPDIEGGEYDEHFSEPSKPTSSLESSSENSSEKRRKQKKKRSTKRVEVGSDDEADPDLQIVRIHLLPPLSC